MDDEWDWIHRSQNGDPNAFELLIKAHQQMIHALAYRMTGSLADAEDLAEETFIHAFQQIAQFRGEARFSSWLYRIALNKCLNWRSREGRRNEAHQAWARDALGGDSTCTNETGANPQKQRVQAALDRLPAKQRAAIVLTVYEDMSHAEAAHILGCTEATVSWRLFSARSKLKRWLRNEVDHE